MKNNKKIAVTIGAIVFVIAGIAASNPPEEKYKNLKVLPKKISSETMDKVMEEFEKALGVGCDFCHVKSESDYTQWDMANDVKPVKSIARKMITMSNKINKDFFKANTKFGDENAVLEVRCVTCHNGEAHPEIEVEKEDNSKQ
jgi:hypothetical protein